MYQLLVVKKIGSSWPLVLVGLDDPINPIGHSIQYQVLNVTGYLAFFADCHSDRPLTMTFFVRQFV